MLAIMDWGNRSVFRAMLRLARDAWSTAIRLRQATNEYAPPPRQWSYDYGMQDYEYIPPMLRIGFRGKLHAGLRRALR